MAIFSVVFGHLAKVPSDGLPYPVFAYTGFAVFTYLTATAAGAAESLAQQQALVTKVFFSAAPGLRWRPSFPLLGPCPS